MPVIKDKDVFRDVINLVPDIHSKGIDVYKKAVNSGLFREMRRTRKELRKSLTGKNNTTLTKKGRNKRFRIKGRNKLDTPLNEFEGWVKVADWKEGAGVFTKGMPKFVKQQRHPRFGMVKYFKPSVSPLGKKIYTPKVGHFQRKAWKKDARTVSKMRGTAQRNVYERAGSGRKFKANTLGSHTVLTGTMHQLMRHRTTIGRMAFDSMTVHVMKQLEHTVKYYGNRAMHGRPKRNATKGK